MCNLLAFDASEHKYSSSVYLLTVPHYNCCLHACSSCKCMSYWTAPLQRKLEIQSCGSWSKKTNVTSVNLLAMLKQKYLYIVYIYIYLKKTLHTSINTTHLHCQIWRLPAYLVTWVRVVKSRDRIDFSTSMHPMYCKEKTKGRKIIKI